MCSLFNFPAPPPEGYVTACELNSEMIAARPGDPSVQMYTHLTDFPQLNFSKEFNQRSFSSKETARSAFIEHKETVWKRVVLGWYEYGLCGSLEEIATAKSEVPWWLSKVARGLITCIRWTNSLHGSLFPHLAMSSEDMIAEFSAARDWQNSPVRAFTWHPHTSRFAVALPDDSIRVYSSKADITPMLKHKLQKGVADLAWKPLSASVLAVACQTCVLIWHVDPTSLATRPSASPVQVLTHHGHNPVTSLAWCPKGGVLVTASPSDTAIMVWDVTAERCTPLRRRGGGGVSYLNWSPDGFNLLAGTPSSLFRVWETQSWSCEKWTELSGRLQTACWSADGDILLFATEREPIIYSLKFPSRCNSNVTASLTGGSKNAISCIDLSKMCLEVGDQEVSVGGPVHAIVWDPTGERLAVQFQGVESTLIALFRTNIKPVFEIMPCGFVQGEPGETPQMMCFQPKYDKGALLTVVWSSGRVAFIPLYFLPSEIAMSGDINGHIPSSRLYSYSP